MSVSLLVLYCQQIPIPDVDIQLWFFARILGWLGILFITISVLYGVASMPVYRSAVIMLFELVVADIAAWWLTNEVMLIRECVGGILIIRSILWCYHHLRHKR